MMSELPFHLSLGASLADRSAGPLRFRAWLPDIEFEGHFVDPSSELERHVVAVFEQRQRRAGVLANIEGFVFREGNRRGVIQGIAGHFLTVHIQLARASLPQTRAIRLEVE